MLKICPTCKKSFETLYPFKVYCSSRCRPGTRKPATKKCAHCGKIFKPKHTNRQKFCSSECYNKFVAEEHKSTAIIPKKKCKKIDAAAFSKQRLIDQKEAFDLGLSFGQYTAWKDSGFLNSYITQRQEGLT